MKKTILIFSCLLVLAAKSFAIMPSEKVLKSFETIFNNPKDAKWYDHVKYYEVTFVQSDVRTDVKFDMEGNFMSSSRYYNAQQLPTNILWKLKKKYADKIIFGVTEITTSDEINYFIKLEDGKHWLTIKVDGNGEMELVERYKKA